MNLYSALQGNYSEALPNQACSKRKVLRWLRNDPEESHEVDHMVGGRPFQRVGPTTEKDLSFIIAVRVNGTRRSPRETDCIELRPTRVTETGIKRFTRQL